MKLNYEPFEHLGIRKPVDRISFIVANCLGKTVLDMGCYDETALSKRNTNQWLHKEISTVAKSILGIDNSSRISHEGISINENSRIVRGDVLALSPDQLGAYSFDLIVAGELIEHLPNVLDFFVGLRNTFQGKQLICSTPNATALSNVILGTLGRESAHRDHLQIYSFKTLNTLCLRAGFAEWEIIPYHVYFTEMILKTSGIKKITVQCSEAVINMCERFFPLLSGGLILNVKKI